MTTVISCVNLKGGVGKTALSVNLAAFCGKRDLKTLLIDMDPQTNATFSCVTIQDWQEFSQKNGTLANLMGVRSTSFSKTFKPEKAVIKDVFENVDLIPSHLEMFTIDLDISGKSGREYILKKSISGFINNYDIVICDCPPNLTIPTQNALAFSDYYVVPVSPDYLSGIGVGLLTDRINKFRDDLQLNSIPCAGIVLSRVGRPSQFREASAGSLKNEFPDLMIDGELRERSAVGESAAKQSSIFEMQDIAARNEFENVCKEILTNIGLA